MSNLPPLPDVSALRSDLDKAIGRRQAAQEQRDETVREIKQLEDEEELLSLVAALFRKMIDEEITEGVAAIEKLLSEGLQSVFDDQDLAVKGDIGVQRGKVSVDLITHETKPDGVVIEGSTDDSYGGAVTTVQSNLMRVIVMLRREMRPLMLLDEALPAFDSNYIHNMAKFLAALCSRLDMDIALVTHNPTLIEAGDKGYRIQKKRGEALFRPVRGGSVREGIAS